MELMTTEQICDLLQIEKRTLRKWMQAGKFPEPIRLNKRVLRWNKEVVLAWLEKQDG